MKQLSIILCLFFASLFSVSLKAADTSISPATYEALNDVQEYLQQEDYINAQELLDKLQSRLKPSFGLALVHQLYGQLYLAQENTPAAIQQFENALKLDVFAVGQESALATNVAQLYLSIEKTDEAIAALNSRMPKLLSDEKKAQQTQKKQNQDKSLIKPITFATLGMAYHIKGDYNNVITWVPEALAREKKSGNQPKENWLQILALAYYERKQYQSAADTLKQLIAIKPDNEDYWVQRASMFQLLEQPGNTLKVLETAYAADKLTKDQNLMLLVQLLINQGIPERGARILKEQLLAQNIEMTESNWRLLASAWQLSRQRQDAIVALSQASEAMSDGSLLLRAARLAVQDNRHAQATVLIQRALDKGLEDNDSANALLLAGSSHFELQHYADARRYFQRALKQPDSATSAKTWLDYIATVEEYL